MASSLQESAARFANTMLANLNASAANTVGVDVMWFRATPDKRSQDVIFQSYTLYGVEDCPISFRAVYSDTGYDDGAITYNIMGLNFSIPMTLDIPLLTWKKATGDDGTIPQEKDVVFVPITRKLLQVASMQPVKAMGGQLTSYKVNLEIYKPMRSRLVGENLKESIVNSTTNLDERFGEDIDESIRDIVDDNQISKYTSTSEDTQKDVTKDVNDVTGKKEVSIIKSYELIVDGHSVARNYYELSSGIKTAVKYKKPDEFTKQDSRCYSAWIRIKTIKQHNPIPLGTNSSLENEDGVYILNVSSTKGLKRNERVILKRGLLSVPGRIISPGRIALNKEQVKELNTMNSDWYKMPGFSINLDNDIRLLSGGDFEISIVGMNTVSILNGEEEKFIRFDEDLKPDSWYGIIINLGEKISVDVFSSESGLERINHVSDIENNIYETIKVKNYNLPSSNIDITNIRLYDVPNIDVDKQILDLISYNARNDSHAIINDSADTYLNQPYMGKQR